MVELLSVIVILAILIALLLPAINAAMRSAKNAAASAEINQMSTALNQFKSQYGAYPPSRIYVNEAGDYSVTTMVTNFPSLSISAASALSQRSVSYLRRIFPRMTLSTSPVNAVLQYDFDGNGSLSPAKVIQGSECLVFFLGGIPQPTNSTASVGSGTAPVFGVIGFAKSPTNPMQNGIAASNRSLPMFEFATGRLVDLDGNGFPEYLDNLGGYSPRPYVYFSAYEGQGYDPDDNNYLDADDVMQGYSNGVLGGFSTPNAPTALRVYNPSARPDIVASEAPNPYTSETPVPVVLTAPITTADIDPSNHKPREYINKNSFQIISAGLDNNFGIGGLFDANNSTESLTFPAVSNSEATGQTLLQAIRIREHDNLTNFKNGKLE